MLGDEYIALGLSTRRCVAVQSNSRWCTRWKLAARDSFRSLVDDGSGN